MSRLSGTPLCHRVSGADLVPCMVERSQTTGWRILLFGSANGVAERAAAQLAERFPGSDVIGVTGGVRQSGLNADQSVRVAVAFARETAKSPTARLCTACVEVLAVSGAGITLMGGDQAGPICVSDSSIAELEDLQCTIGQGPCRDAYRSGRSVHALRMDESAFVRWSPFVHLVRST